MPHTPDHDDTADTPDIGPEDATPEEGIERPRTGARRPDEDAPGNYVDDPDAEEIPEPNEPA